MAACLWFSSPPADHPTEYGKFVMDKQTKAKNKQKIHKKYIYQQVSQFPNTFFLGRLILDKEEHILSLKLRDFIPKIKGRLRNHVL